MISARRLEKILVPTNGEDWHGMTSELLWGTALNDLTYRIENCPLYAYGISYHDVVRCSTHDKMHRFDFVIVKGGHSNYRVLLRTGRNSQDFLERWPVLEKLGCRYESSRDPEDVFAVDVPPESDVYAVFDILNQGEQDQIWYLDEGNLEHALQRC